MNCSTARAMYFTDCAVFLVQEETRLFTSTLQPGLKSLLQSSSISKSFKRILDKNKLSKNYSQTLLSPTMLFCGSANHALQWHLTSQYIKRIHISEESLQAGGRCNDSSPQCLQQFCAMEDAESQSRLIIPFSTCGCVSAKACNKKKKHESKVIN